jgi:ferrochelatase
MSDAIILVNMGGPASRADVRPYLRNIFRDPAIIALPGVLRTPLANLIARRRAPEVAERYDLIGGSSPLYYWSERLCGEMQRLLSAMANDTRITYAFRYSTPAISEVLADLDAEGFERVVLIPLFPHYTNTMSGSVEQEANRAARALSMELEIVGEWGHDADIIDLYTDYAKSALEAAGDGARVLFVAHGIPAIYVRRGDDYPNRVQRTANLIAERLPAGTEFSLAFQSKVGPLKWTAPYLEPELARLSAKKLPLALVPLSFAADCLETQFDLDIVAKTLCDKHKIVMSRARVFNDDPRFAGILLRLAREATHAHA